MRVFHAVMSGPELRAIRLFDDGELDMLISANILNTDYRWKKNLELLHKKKNLLIADSGMIGFVKRLGYQAILDYALNPDKVLELQLKVEPDIVVMTDLLLLLKLFVIQGETLEDYIECIEWYEREGFFSIENAWFGIGSVAFRDQTERREIISRISTELPSGMHVHVFGVGSPKYLLELNEMGIQSADSSMACMSGVYFSFLDEGGERRRLRIRKKDKYMTSALIAWNMAIINLLVKKGAKAGQLELFEEVVGWG